MDAYTSTVVEWVLSAPVLAKRLAMIVGDEPVFGYEELPCTVVDLLNPKRDVLAVSFLRATGANLDGADAVWMELSAGDVDRWQWMDDVDWDAVREALTSWTEDRREEDDK